MGTSFGFAMEMTGTRWFFPVNLQAFKGNRTIANYQIGSLLTTTRLRAARVHVAIQRIELLTISN